MGHPLVDRKTRELAVKLLQAGNSYQETADLLGIGIATVNRAWREFREQGAVSQPRRRGGRASALNGDEMEELRKLVLSKPDATYDEITAAWNKKKRQSWSRSVIVRKVLRLGFTRKKKSVEAAEKKKKVNLSKRASFRFLRKSFPIEKLVFLDEAGFQAHSYRSHARSIRGYRATAFEPVRASKTITVTGAIRLTGPVAMHGEPAAMNTVRFLRFLRRKLLPRLHPNDILVLDNLSSHRNKKVRQLCRRWSIRIIYLPPYSPEFNPIEKVWSWMKLRLRARLNRALHCFRYAISGAWRKSATLCMNNLFRSCGYLESCH